MRWLVLLLACVAFPVVADAGLFRPLSDVEVDIPELIKGSSFVCKGTILTAPKVRNISGPLPRMTGIAVFEVDRCFKGKLVGAISVRC
jgi:hypothetical protein